MPVWRILVYTADDARRAAFTAWLEQQDSAVRAKVDAALVTLSGESDWEHEDVTEFKPLTDRDVGLGEVILEIIERGKKRQIRCLGIWPADQNEFVLLNGLEKFGRSPKPPDAYAEAHRLRKQYGQGRGMTDDYFK